MRKFWCMIYGSLLFLICLVCIKNEWCRKLYKNANYGMEALISKGEIENLFIGSSMFRQGIDIFALEETLGEDSFILAYNGNQPAYEYLELRYLLEKGVRIENLYLDMYVYSAAAEPKVSDKRLLAHTDTKFKIDVWKMLKTCSKSGLSVFWEMFVTANNETFLTFPINHKLTNTLYHKGGNVQNNEGATIEKIASMQIPKAQNNQINLLQKESIIKIITLCKKYNILLKFIETPKWHSVSEDYDYQSLIRQYIQVLMDNDIPYSLSQKTAEFVSISGGENIIEFDSENPKYFIDTVHMSSDGRKQYSSQLLK